MTRLTEILEDPALNGVYRVAGPLSDMPDLIRLDGRQLTDKTDLLSVLGHELDFPTYYGVNWDALEECLFDLSWWEGSVVVLLEHAEALDVETLHTLADIWTEAAAAWGDAGRSCVLLIEGAEMPGLPIVD